jgi:uncharacterized protein (DUF1697 family)
MAKPTACLLLPRGINVGGKNKIDMAKLRALAAAGYRLVRTADR